MVTISKVLYILLFALHMFVSNGENCVEIDKQKTNAVIMCGRLLYAWLQCIEDSC